MQQHEAQSVRCWSTRDVDQNRALAYWVDTVCDRFIALDIDTPTRDAFCARLEQVDLGPATANFLQAQSQHVIRTRARIARSTERVFVLLHLRAGEGCLSQYGRDAYVRAGHSVLMDGGTPYAIEFPRATRGLALRLPEDWLERWLPNPSAAAARVFDASGWAAPLNAALANLNLDSYNQLALPASVVAEQVGALLALAVGRQTGQLPRASLYDQLLCTLRDRLHEPDLTPAAVARAHSISKRSLYYAFATAGTLFTRELLRLRLEQAQTLLSDARFSHLTLTEIWARCGFNEGTHFSRCFRERFGRSPSQYRDRGGSEV